MSVAQADSSRQTLSAELRIESSSGLEFHLGSDAKPDFGPGSLDHHLEQDLIRPFFQRQKDPVVFGAEDPAFGSPDPISMRDEQLVDLDLSAFDRFLFAYRGLQTVTELLAQARPDDQNLDPSSRA